MKRILLFCLAFLALTRLPTAHPQSAPTLDSLAGTGATYLVRVAAVKDGQDDREITFVITEALRGQSRNPLTLRGYFGKSDDEYKQSSEWILIENKSGDKNTVGWALEGDCEWLPISVTRTGDKVSTEIGSLDAVKQYLRDHPTKS